MKMLRISRSLTAHYLHIACATQSGLCAYLRERPLDNPSIVILFRLIFGRQVIIRRQSNMPAGD